MLITPIEITSYILLLGIISTLFNRLYSVLYRRLILTERWFIEGT